MKNKKFTAIILLIFTVILGGCNSDNENNDKLQINSVGGEIENKVTDQQISFVDNKICESEYGFYYGSVFHVMYYDKASDINTILCFNSACNHQDDECTGIFNDFLAESVAYNGGSLYIAGYDKNSEDIYDVYLYRVSLDGSVREKLFKTATYEYSMSQDPMIIHRGYYYFTTGSRDEDGKAGIYRRKLEKNSEIETVYETDKGSFADISNLICYEDKLYFEYMYCVDKKENEYNFYLMKTDINSLETNIEVENFKVNWFYISDKDKILAYTIDSNIKEYNLAENTVENILELEKDKVHIFTCDGDYIYFERSGRVEVYTKDGKKLQDINTDIDGLIGDFLYGNDDYLFCSCISDNMEFILYKGNKKLLEKGEFKWEKCGNGA